MQFIGMINVTIVVNQSLWYNKGMDSDIILAQAVDIVDSDLSKRVIADALRAYARSTVMSYGHANKVFARADYLAEMLWQGITEGTFQYADGVVINLKDEKDGTKLWLDLVKFVANHIDGPTGTSNNFNGVNIFKSYKGIDTDRV